VNNPDRAIIQVTPRYYLGGSTYRDSNRFIISAQFNGTNEITFYFRNVNPAPNDPPNTVPTVGNIAISFSIIEQEY
jgi:hypothetical protein